MGLERSRAVAAEADLVDWAVVTVRSDGAVEASSSGARWPSLAPGARVPPALVALLSSGDRGEHVSSSHDIIVGDERWRCVMRPVPVGPTVLLVRRLGDETPGTTHLLDVGLTPRQTEVAAALVCSGGTNAQLARQLDISEGTVKKHLETVFRVLGVESRSGAIVALNELSGVAP